MELLVPIRQVTRVAGTVEIEDGELPETAVSYDLNEWDRYAIAAAVDIATDLTEATVTLVTVGPERTEAVLNEGLAMGADEALRVWDPSLAPDSRPRADITPVVAILAAIVSHRQPALVLTGAQSSDTARAATGVAIAEQAGYAWASRVIGATLDPDAERLKVRRELEDRLEARLTVELPALLTVQTGIVSIESPTESAETESIAVRSPAAWGLDAETLTGHHREAITGMRIPAGLQAVDRTTGEPEALAEEMVDTLRTHGVLQE